MATPVTRIWSQRIAAAALAASSLVLTKPDKEGSKESETSTSKQWQIRKSLLSQDKSEIMRDYGREKEIERTMTIHSPQTPYELDREQQRLLGVGAYGKVYLTRDCKTKELVAVKKMAKSDTNPEDFAKEVEIHERIRELGGHPNICALRRKYEDDNYFYLEMDYISGGELLDHLNNCGVQSEAFVSCWIKGVVSALAFLHSIGVVHADLKLENVMLGDSNPEETILKIVDFGSAALIKDEDGDEANQTRSFGTLAYCPPEHMFDRDIPALPSKDMYSLGVILYTMLTDPPGLPFDGSDDLDIMAQILDEDFKIRGSTDTQHLSDDAVDVLCRLMDRNPETRMTAVEFLSHPWVRQGEFASTMKKQ